MKQRASSHSETRGVSARRSGSIRGSARLSGRSGPARGRRGASPGGQRPGRQASARKTTDHEEIMHWAEQRKAHPATVKRTAKDKNPAGILRLDFPGYTGRLSLKPISWDEWFEVFEDRKLALLYQEKTASGKPSNFNKLVCR